MKGGGGITNSDRRTGEESRREGGNVRRRRMKSRRKINGSHVRQEEEHLRDEMKSAEKRGTEAGKKCTGMERRNEDLQGQETGKREKKGIKK